VLGVQHVLLSTMSPGWGYTAIAVALLGGLTPFGILFAAVLFGALEIGATNMQYAAGVPAAVGGFIEGLVLVLFLISIPLALSRDRVRRAVAAVRPRRRQEG
jgi:simple sugar transport system permease protein